MDIDYFKVELDYVLKEFNLDNIIAFQKEHDVQIIRGEDWQYVCYIDKKVYSVALTFMGALVEGIEKYNLIHEQS